MVNQEMIKALNGQIREELNSFYVYLAMAADMESKNLVGAGAWFRKQANEEMGHAMRIYAYINDVGGKVVLEALEKPIDTYASLTESFDKALNHEKHITKCIHDLVRLARKLDDIATENFLQWFVNEQVEEEKTASEILARIGIAGERNHSLYFIDKDLGKRAAVKSED